MIRHETIIQEIPMKAKSEFAKCLPGLVIPIVIQNLVSALVSTADVVMLGAVGQSAISAVSLAGQVTFVLNLFYFGIVTGVVTMGAQYWGKKDAGSICTVNGIALRCSALISALFFLAALCVPELLMRVFTPEEELIRLGAAYLRIVSFSYLFMGFSQIYLAVMKSVGRVRVTTLVSSGCLALNIFLNAVFIYGLLGMPKWGVAGVALATSTARLLELLFCLLDEHRQSAVPCRFTDLLRGGRGRVKVLRKDFYRYMSPALGNYLVWGGGFTMYSVIMGHLDSDAVAANSIASVVRNLAVIFGTGVGSGGSLYLGQLIGDGRLEDARRDAGKLCRLALGFGVLGGAGILLCRPWILSAANLTDTALAYLSAMLFINSYYCVGKALNSTVVGGIFCAGADTRFGLVCDAVVMWAFAIPLGFVLAFICKAPVEWVYFAICLDELVKLPFVYGRFKKYKWLNNITRDFTPAQGGNEP